MAAFLPRLLSPEKLDLSPFLLICNSSLNLQFFSFSLERATSSQLTMEGFAFFYKEVDSFFILKCSFSCTQLSVEVLNESRIFSSTNYIFNQVFSLTY